MPIDLTKLNELKRLLTTSPQISVVLEYFFDHFAEDLTFMAQSTPLPPESETFQIIESVAGQVASHFLKKPGSKPVNLKILEISAQGFAHGGCRVGDRMLTIIYFDDIKTGALAMAALPGMPGGDGTTHFSRFTTTPLQKPIDPTTALHAAPKKRTIH